MSDQKQITINYSEYLEMEREIAKLKEANSALCQGAPIYEVNKFEHRVTYHPQYLLDEYRAVFAPADDLICVAGRFIAKGKEAGVEFEGVEELIGELEGEISRLKSIKSKIDSAESPLGGGKKSWWDRLWDWL